MSKKGRFVSFQIILRTGEDVKDMMAGIKKILPLRYTGTTTSDAPLVCEFDCQDTQRLTVCVKIFLDSEDNAEVDAVLGFFGALETLRG